MTGTRNEKRALDPAWPYANETRSLAELTQTLQTALIDISKQLSPFMPLVLRYISDAMLIHVRIGRRIPFYCI